MADLLSKLRMLDAAPRRPAPAARGAQEGCYRSQATFPLPIFTDLRHLTPAVMESAFGFAFPSDLRPEDILFLDTETTGLAGGAGTVAFLVGMGYFTGRDFAVEQVLMRDYGQESELLRTVSAVAGRFSVLCTFNGRTFDAPLLASRFVMNRLPSRLPSVHADVLYPARRLWKLRLKRCNLANLEEQLLHVKREDDLPGAEVPQTYFRYLRDGDFAPIERILAHNRQDIVSLAQLLCFLCGQVDCPETVESGQDLLSLARSREKWGDTAKAVKCYRLCARGDTRAEAYHALARERRRAGDVTAAIRLYETMLRRGDDPVSACEALAKLYEHRLHNPAQALTYTRQALLLLSEPGLFRSEAVQARQVALQYRYARLRRKLCAPCATSTKKEEPSSWES